MNSNQPILGLLSTVLIWSGCTTTSVQTFSGMPTVIEPHEVLAIVVFDETTGLATNAEDCVRKALKEDFPTLRIISSDEFYRKAFPDPAPEMAVRASPDISLLLKDAAFRERIALLGLRYLISIRGGTLQKGEPFAGGIAGGVTWAGVTWDRQSDLTASVLDLKKSEPAGSVWVSASGKPWIMCIGLLVLCAPVGSAAFTESEACENIGKGIVKFLKGEELPEPVRVVLSSQLPPPKGKIGSGEKLSLTLVDKRKRDFLGYWRGVGEGKIRALNSFETILSEAFWRGFSNLGYEVLDSPAIGLPNLELTIQNFEYWTAYHVNVDAEITAVLYKGDRRVVERSYTINNKFDKPFNYSRDASWIEEKINASISDLIFRIVTDQELLVSLKE